MSWEHRGTNIYYYHKVRVAGELRCWYLGKGEVAEKVAASSAALQRTQRLLRQKLAAARHWVAIEIDRIERLCGTVDSLMKVAGFYLHRGQWRRRGITTMRTIESADNILQAIERERARRHFESVDEIDSEIEKYGVDLSTFLINELINKLTSDFYRQEAFVRRVGRVEAELAGENPSASVNLLARQAAILSLECDFADLTFYRTVGLPDGLPITSDIERWRNLAHRSLLSTIKALAYVRKVEASSLEHVIDRLRIAS